MDKPVKVDLDGVDTEPPSKNWRMLIRRHSEKIGTIAEDIVLPKNERIFRRASRIETVEMQRLNTSVATEPGPTKKKSEHFPVFMIVISIIQVFFFYSFDDDMLAMKFGYDPYRRHEVWRFFTAMLVHTDYSHLWGNVVMQLLLGVLLEIVHQWKRIAIIYFASALGGSLLTTVLANGHYSVGASDGVYGLIFSHLATLTLNWSEMNKKFSKLFCVLLYITHDIGSTLYTELVLKVGSSGISHVAHVGGAVTGFLVSILVLKNFHKRPWEKTLQQICVGILIALFTIALIINIFCSSYFPPTEWNFNYEESYLGTGVTDITDTVIGDTDYATDSSERTEYEYDED